MSIGLAGLGLVAGDVISFQMTNWIEAAVVNLAATLSGLVINPIVPISRDAEVGMMLANRRSKAFLVASSFPTMISPPWPNGCGRHCPRSSMSSSSAAVAR
ncbi:hypothetical protein [Sphingomonas sp.]|uniref:hypothetical protein n=1 Tax=Sphingomonas sp. TaxID=28214 RepID=UPI003751AB41